MFSNGACRLSLDSLDGGDFLVEQAQLAADLLFDRLERGRVVLEELLDVFAPLAEPLARVGEPRAALLDDLPIDGQIEQLASLRDALAVHHVDLGLADRRRPFFLDDLDAGAPA